MIIGHNRIVKYLSEVAKSGNLSHAYLFSGPESLGKMALATEFAKFLQCPNAKNGKQPFDYCGQCKDCYDMDRKSHPDFTVFPPAMSKENEIKIGQIRDLIRIFGFKNYSAPHKIAIIDNADQMTNEAANALLKTLEEPGENSILILITSHPESLLSTIVSRCQQIKFFAVPYLDLEKGLLNYFNGDSSVLADIPEAARLSSGRPGIAVKIIQNPAFKEKKEENCRTFLKLNDFSLSLRYQYVSSMLAKEDDVADILNNWLYVLKDVIYLHFGAQRFIPLRPKTPWSCHGDEGERGCPEVSRREIYLPQGDEGMKTAATGDEERKILRYLTTLAYSAEVASATKAGPQGDFILNSGIKNQLENLRGRYSLRKATALMNEIKETIFILRTTNVNKKLALENLMLEL